MGEFDLCQYGRMTAAPTPELASAASSCRDLSAPLARSDAEQLATVIKAIADPARLQILSVLRAAPGRAACAGEFAAPLGLGQPTISHHLKVLHATGILQRERRGSWIYYRLSEERIAELCTTLLGPC